MSSSVPGATTEARFDADRPHPARRYNYWLGGDDHFASDRRSAYDIERLFPNVQVGALANRSFLRRATALLTREAGIRQFLDIGIGLQSDHNAHQVAQAIAPDSRVVYVDNDRTVIAHALHFIPGQGVARSIVDKLLRALPRGSFVVASHATADFANPAGAVAYQHMLAEGRVDIWPRNRADFTELFGNTHIVSPGVVAVNDWMPDIRTPTIPLRRSVCTARSADDKRYGR